MKLRTKFTIALFIVLLVPLLLLAISLAVLNSMRNRTFRRDYGIEDGTAVNILAFYSGRAFDAQFTQLTESLAAIEQDEPARLAETATVAQLAGEIDLKNAYLMAERGGTFYFNGGEDNGDILQYVTEYPVAGTQTRYYVSSGIQYLIGSYEFDLDEDGKGTVFLIGNVSKILPEMRNTVIFGVIILSLILVGTFLAMLYWEYRFLVRPIRKLRKATKAIGEGNLDYEVEPLGNDEISDLCRDFEGMRRTLKANAEEQRQYEQEGRELVRNISHDLKTPITAIQGYAEGIIDGVASSPEKQERYVRTILNKAKDMNRLIDELTLYSQLETNRPLYHFRRIPVRQYFDDCAEELKVELEAKGITLEYTNDLPAGTEIVGDPEQLKKVVNNIISNSEKYMDKKQGLIQLRVRDQGGSVRVEIEDNGRGIAAKDLPYIFDRFYRADVSRSPRQGGSGIGLSIVKKIVEDHGGRIWAAGQEGFGAVMMMEFRKYQETAYE